MISAKESTKDFEVWSEYLRLLVTFALHISNLSTCIFVTVSLCYKN